MDEEQARILEAQTREFYDKASTSFAQTRRAPWPGMRRVLDECHHAGVTPREVLDLACGNLRFESLLAMDVQSVVVHGIDCCDELVGLGCLPANIELRYRHLDIARSLRLPDEFEGTIPSASCDLAVCFAFLHHLPLPEQRYRLMRGLVASTRPGGIVAVSLWQFLRSERLRRLARPVVGGGPGDHLLGWQGRRDIVRYCHHFSEDEVDDLATCVDGQAKEIARFSADGKDVPLNRYLVLQVGEQRGG